MCDRCLVCSKAEDCLFYLHYILFEILGSLYCITGPEVLTVIIIIKNLSSACQRPASSIQKVINFVGNSHLGNIEMIVVDINNVCHL